MTRRERLEAKVEKRGEWAEKATARSEERFETIHAIMEHMPAGQPILVGHHSEKRHRADVARIDSNMSKACAETALAKHHTAKAEGLQFQLDTCIFSDDENAVESLTAKIAVLEDKQAHCNAVNAAIRKNLKNGPEARLAAVIATGCTEEQARIILAPDCFDSIGFPSYVTRNNGANIRRLKKRLIEVTARQARATKAQENGSGIVIEGTSFIRITFADKPDLSVLIALKAAGYQWRGGSWYGQRADLPAEISGLLEARAGGRDTRPGGDF